VRSSPRVEKIDLFSPRRSREVSPGRQTPPRQKSSHHMIDGTLFRRRKGDVDLRGGKIYQND